MGEAALALINSILSILSFENLTFDFIYEQVFESCFSLIRATWAEVMIVTDDHLKILGKTQGRDSFEINENSLPGYSCMTKAPQIINNATQSRFYSSFNQ